MGLITITDLEDATGVTVTDSDKAQFMIDSISAYVERYTDQKFTPQSDITIRAQADTYGVIEFPDVTSVSSVTDAKTGGNVAYYFDEMNKVYGLTSYQAVDVTLDYGWDTVPDDILGIVVTLVAAGLGIPYVSDGEISRKRVGDVETEYAVSVSEQGIQVTPSSLMQSVLESYRIKTRTWRIGPLYYPTTNTLPTL